MKLELNPANIVWLQRKNRDDVGKIFRYEGKILRGIYHSKVNLVQSILNSGFLNELIDKGFFPKTTVSNYSYNDFAIILEHEEIHPVVYPQDWTFSMLKNAALMVLEVATLARKYNLNMKDCHSLNVLFDGTKPMFIDFGSFHPSPSEVTGWQPMIEFLRCYYYPMYLWSTGKNYIAKLSIFSGNLMPMQEHYIYKYRFLRYLDPAIVKNLIKLRHGYYRLTTTPEISCKIERKFKAFSPFIKLIAKTSKIATNNNLDLKKLEKMIKSMNRPYSKTMWSHYHNNITKKKERFPLIIDKINKYCPEVQDCIDIAGNQGLFSRIILDQTNIKNVICQDMDEFAVDSGFVKTVENPLVEKKLTFANYDAFSPITKSSQPNPSFRYKCDLVVCLALLHHLILSQGYSIEFILDQLSSYSRKYVFVEFMPKGLWIRGGDIDVPDWYTLDWFRSEFEKKFEKIDEMKIDDNYILFVGKKSNQKL